jgi:hypothetical protein
MDEAQGVRLKAQGTSKMKSPRPLGLACLKQGWKAMLFNSNQLARYPLDTHPSFPYPFFISGNPIMRKL